MLTYDDEMESYTVFVSHYSYIRTGYKTLKPSAFSLRGRLAVDANGGTQWPTFPPIQSTTQHFKVVVLSNGVTTQLSNAVTL